MMPGCWRNRDRVNSMQSAGVIMPHGIPLGQPDRFIEFQPYSHDFCDGLPRDLAKIFHWHSRIGVHHRPKRNRYTICGKPISRRTIDRLVYFGVLDEAELQNG